MTLGTLPDQCEIVWVNIEKLHDQCQGRELKIEIPTLNYTCDNTDCYIHLLSLLSVKLSL